MGKASSDGKAKKAFGVGTLAKAKSTSSSSVEDSYQDRIIQALLIEYKFGKTKPVHQEKLAKKCSTHVRTKSFLDAIKSLVAKGFIAKDGGGIVLTDEGAASAGFVKTDLSKFGTNAELHKHIKSSLNPKWKGAQIFDFLLNHSPQSRKELAQNLDIHERSHSFNYGLKELKESEYVVQGSDKKYSLSDNAVVTP